MIKQDTLGQLAEEMLYTYGRGVLVEQGVTAYEVSQRLVWSHVTVKRALEYWRERGLMSRVAEKVRKDASSKSGHKNVYRYYLIGGSDE